MIILEVLMCVCFLVLSAVTIKSDISEGLIHNRTLLAFAAAGTILDCIYYGFFLRKSGVAFLINLLVVTAICLFLFYTHSFAGGDCKLGFVMALLYPGGFYLSYGSTSCTLFFAIGFAIIYGYLYMLISAGYKIAAGKTHVTPVYIGNYLIEFVKRYIKSLIYLCGINLIVIAVELCGIYINAWIVRLLCIGIVWLIGKNNLFAKWQILLPVTALDLIGSIWLKVIPLSLSIEHYVLVGILLISQMTIKTNLYQEVEVAQLKKGMILSTLSSVRMQGSRVRGLPSVSSEDLRSRLTEMEIESIQRWAQSKNVSTVSVVRKIPFAIFLALGFASYFVLWGVVG